MSARFTFPIRASAGLADGCRLRVERLEHKQIDVAVPEGAGSDGVVEFRGGETVSRTIAVIAAHPDDEVLGCGATIARHAAAGDQVHVLIVAEGVTSRDAVTGTALRRGRTLRPCDECSQGACDFGVCQPGNAGSSRTTDSIASICSTWSSQSRRFLPRCARDGLYALFPGT